MSKMPYPGRQRKSFELFTENRRDNEYSTNSDLEGKIENFCLGVKSQLPRLPISIAIQISW